MALSRKFLSAMGITAEQIDQIIEAHTDTVNSLKEQIQDEKDKTAKAQAEADKLSAVQKELDDLKAQVDADNKAREGKDYDALKKEFDDYKAEQQAKETRTAKETAYRAILKDLNVSEKGIKLAVKYGNIDALELDEEGKVKDGANLRKTIKEDWGDYIVKTEEKGADEKNPPTNASGGGKTKDEIMAIKDSAERQKAIAENPALFGIE